jgi:hypothetical protein
MNLIWNRNKTPKQINILLQTLADEYNICENGDGINLEFKKVENHEMLRVRKSEDSITIEYNTLQAAARGVGYALAGMEADEKLTFKTFALLLECSRGGVITVKYFKHWLRRLALMGYNMVMLYTKDAYQLPGETYFGYMRGAYSLDEIREMDAYAARLGVEMIASIQALGHLEPTLRWQAYRDIKDTDNVILVDEEKSYILLEKMLAFWSEALSSSRIHIGMDETHDLGRGRFMDLYGYERGFDIFNRHLSRVCGICDKFGLKPMIWSDMYFRFGNENQDYYDSNSVIPENVKNAIDRRVELVYWDYYHYDEAFYTNFIKRHRELGREPLVAPHVRTPYRLWYEHKMTVATASPCIDACRKSKIREIIFTAWGDDGSYCEFDSAFAGLAWAADYAFNDKADDERIGKFFRAIFSADYQTQIAAGELEVNICPDMPYDVRAVTMLWDDPLMGIIWNEYSFFNKDIWQLTLEKLRKLEKKLIRHCDDNNVGHISHAWTICCVLIKKLEFRLALLRAYRENDRQELSQLKDDAVPEIIKLIEKLNISFRKQWMRSYKPYGLELMQIRLAGLCERYRETGRRITAYLSGESDSIDEIAHEYNTCGKIDMRYRMIATGSWFV